MRGIASPLVRNGRLGQLGTRSSYVCRQCRGLQMRAAPTSSDSSSARDPFAAPVDASSDVADAQFQVLGTSASLLSVTLSASQRLYTRRGTLVAVSGKAQNAKSTLTVLPPLTRAVTGVPFLYQRITSTTPLTALISTKSRHTTFAVLRLDGTTDWVVSQRNALLAWTGYTLAVTPRLQHHLPFYRWGSSELTGRGLAALSAPGQMHQLILGDGEEFVAHPSHVVAYTINKHRPLPFQFINSYLRFQVPSVATWLQTNKFMQNMQQTETYKFLARILYSIRTTARRTIWGDRLFLQFRGPMTILMSTGATRVSDVLTDAEVNEIADAPPGTIAEWTTKLKPTEKSEEVKSLEESKELKK